VVRWREGKRFRHATLLSNLLNTPWAEIHRLHRNRSCKRAAEVHAAEAAMFWRRIAASLMILGVFAFRNMKTWASVLPAQAAIPATTVAATSPAATVALVDSPRKAEVFSRMGQTVDYIRALTGSGKSLRGVSPSLSPFGYDVRVRGGTVVESMAAGSVVFVDAQGNGETGKTVVVHHGNGFSTVYGNLESIAPRIRMGSAVGMGEALGTVAPGRSRLHLEARMSKRYIERGIEASVSEILTPGANLMLDPTGKLVFREARAAGTVEVGPAADSGTFTPRSFRDTVHAHSGGAAPPAWNLGEVELFRLTASGNPIDTIFIASSHLDGDVREEELATDEIVMAQIMDELLDLEGLTDIS